MLQQYLISVEGGGGCCYCCCRLAAACSWIMQVAQAGVHKLRATKFITVAPNACGYSVWNLLHVTLLAPRIFRWLLDFGEFVHPWAQVQSKTKFICTTNIQSCI